MPAPHLVGDVHRGRDADAINERGRWRIVATAKIEIEYGAWLVARVRGCWLPCFSSPPPLIPYSLLLPLLLALPAIPFTLCTQT